MAPVCKSQFHCLEHLALSPAKHLVIPMEPSPIGLAKNSNGGVHGPTSCRWGLTYATFLLQALPIFFVASNHPSAVILRQSQTWTSSTLPFCSAYGIWSSLFLGENIPRVTPFMYKYNLRPMGTSSTCFFQRWITCGQNPRHWMTSLRISIPGIFFLRATSKVPKVSIFSKGAIPAGWYKVGTAPTSYK